MSQTYNHSTSRHMDTSDCYISPKVIQKVDRMKKSQEIGDYYISPSIQKKIDSQYSGAANQKKSNCVIS